MNFVKTIAASTVVLASLLPFSALAQAFTVKDVAGREVKFDKPVQRVILGEGRMLYSVAPIEKEDPFAKIVGWRNDLWTTDVGSFNAYIAKFPKAKDLPFLGNLTDGTLQTETVVKLNPDVMLLPVESKAAADEVKLEQMLGGIGVKIVYIDFRVKILANTEPSIRILGQIFGHEDRAEALAVYWKQQMARVTDKVKSANPTRPNVFMYRAAGLLDCCSTFGPDNFGLMVDWAGGHNLGSDFLPGFSGVMNAEQVVKSNPDVIIVTGSDWTNTKDAKNYVSVGPGTQGGVDKSRAALNALMENPAFTGSKAVASGNVHAVWHQFYTSPYQFVAVQQFAKWLQPDLFKDLDPEATFKEFHEKFLPIAYQPNYWLDAKASK